MKPYIFSLLLIFAACLNLAAQQNQQVIVTGFNGGYMGYLTPSRHYSLDEYEVRDMNFYGKWGGDYLTAMFKKVMQAYQRSGAAKQ